MIVIWIPIGGTETAACIYYPPTLRLDAFHQACQPDVLFWWLPKTQLEWSILLMNSLVRLLLLASIAAFLGAFANPRPASALFLAIDYAPLQFGNEWTYLENGVSTLTQRVLDDLEVVNGIPTFVILDLDGEFSGSTVNLTNDSNGLRMHKLFLPGSGDPPNSTAIFIPPLTLLNAVVDAGNVINSAGAVNLTFEGFGTFGLSYTATANVIGLETVTVPLGTFDALRVDSSLRLFGDIFNQPFDEFSSGTDWYGFGVGPVKSTSDGDVSELVHTNVPEPSAALLALFGLGTVALLARQRSSSPLSSRAIRPDDRLKWTRSRSRPNSPPPS